jgi:hypothetical protein
MRDRRLAPAKREVRKLTNVGLLEKGVGWAQGAKQVSILGGNKCI